ncbi:MULTISPECIES: vitamin K epoxide reductase family protein [Prochlorococcus]|uniref:vitamin K epoxide reductase family protein n=1 Tax=Prochlorococcus TaxID=1218 RepID=UPI000533AFFE|nr:MULTISPECIES: vitamin K epoxide reductase family protein [Prochlorococcus]KGG13275.1 hypothetical protein EV05_0954 [Prochlorococcus sp. MIT 0601]
MESSLLKSRRRNDQGSKWARILVAVLATVGVIDTGSITFNRWGWIGSLSCPGGVEGCDKVLSSPWGNIFDGSNFSVPLSLIGLISYLTLLLLAILPLFPGLVERKKDSVRQTWWGLFLISIGMVSFSFLLIGIMLFKIKAFCFFCILSAFISTIILILTIISGGLDEPREMIYRGFLVSVAVLLGGFIWSASVDPSRSEALSNSQGVAPPAVVSKSTTSAIALAEHLTAIGAVKYSAYWCPHCHDQQEIFGKEAVKKLLLVECAPDGLNSQTKLCKEKNIEGFPSWEINGELQAGVKSLEELANISNYKGPRDF